MEGPKFEFYVLNHSWNNGVEMWNIFNNCHVYEHTLKDVKKYCRNPKKYMHKTFAGSVIYGFDAFCEELRTTIHWQEWSRCEYEIGVGEAFMRELSDIDLDKFNTLEDLKEEIRKGVEYNRNKGLEKWDCYMQAEPNIQVIAREVIYQYRQWLKENKKPLKELEEEGVLVKND